MPKKRHKTEEIIAKLDMWMFWSHRARSVADAIRQIDVTEGSE